MRDRELEIEFERVKADLCEGLYENSPQHIVEQAALELLGDLWGTSPEGIRKRLERVKKSTPKNVISTGLWIGGCGLIESPKKKS